jgi:predicted TIM-barrel fold metal-dependent hydrolase
MRYREKYLYLSIAATIALLLTLNFTLSKSSSPEYFSINDFDKLNKIDTHCHIFSKDGAFLEQAAQDNFKILTIMFDTRDELTLEEQLETATYQQRVFPKILSFITTFTMQGWEDKDWQEKAISHIQKTVKQGAVGIKVWKNIGLVDKDSEGNFIMIDNPRFDPIFSYLEENNIPIIGHIGEPRNCWLPLDSMTTNADRDYYRSHPQYHMYLHPEYPRYEELMAARNRVLDKHPDLKFIGAHLASVEWDLDKLSELLDKYPNLWVDTAGRLCHLQYHAQKDLKKTQEFIIKYQDRILYATDLGNYEDIGLSGKDLKEYTHNFWLNDWKFFTTNETMTAKEIDGEFSGLKLPKKVIEKIYYKNAEKLFPKLCN